MPSNPPTKTETAIRNRRKTVESGAVLLPLFEELLRKPIKIEDNEDVRFLTALAARQTRPREKGVYSPSMLGSCMRQAYFAKTQSVPYKEIERPVVNTYFSYGDFVHLRLQFWLHKLDRQGKLTLIDCEIRVHGSSRDFAGTIDAIVEIDGIHYIIDFKGWNTSLFMSLVRHGLGEKEKQQIVGYAIIANSTDMFDFAIHDCLLVAEHKGGPIQSAAPFGFYEEHVLVHKVKQDVKDRIGALRRHEEKNVIPEPECVSLRESQFEECPFQDFCRAEVRGIQQQRRADAALRNEPRPRVAISTRKGNASTGRR